LCPAILHMDSTPPPHYTSSIIESSPPLQHALPILGSVPPHQYTPSTGNSIPPFYYAFESVYGISAEVDEWITGTAPECYLHSCANISYLTNTATMHKSKLTLLAMTRAVLRLTLRSRERDWPHPRYRPMTGLRLLPVAIVHNIVKPPYHLARMVIAISQSKHEWNKVEDEVENEILCRFTSQGSPPQIQTISPHRIGQPLVDRPTQGYRRDYTLLRRGRM
jgi:hypothetical protein